MTSGFLFSGNPWVYNTYTKEYEAWSWDMVNIGKRNGTLVQSSMGLDYTPPDADQRRYINDLDRKRFRDKGDPKWWIEKYGRLPKNHYKRKYDPQKGY